MLYTKIALQNSRGSQSLWVPKSQRLGWAAPANLTKDDTTSHYGAHKHSLQYNLRPNWRVALHVGMWNMSSMSENREVCELLKKRMIDVCCLQEVRWREQGSRKLEIDGRTSMLWWSGKGDGVGGVGVMAKKNLC